MGKKRGAATRTAGAAEIDESQDPLVRVAANWARAGWEHTPHLMAALSIMRVEALIRTAGNLVLEPLGLTPIRHETLGYLYFSTTGRRTMGQLGELLHRHPTSVTSTVDSLERSRYVERAAHPTDRRATMAAITERGRKVFETVAEHIETTTYAVDGLSYDDATTIYELLRKVRAAAGDL
jgi:DNA-binding MarR family transcriptional regulator